MIKTQNLIESINRLLDEKGLAIVPASEDEYLSVAFDYPHRIEYHNSEIITMGLASIWHEVIVMTFGTLLNNIFSENDDVLVMGSNFGVHVPKFEGGYYMPDVVVVKGQPQFKGNSTAIVTNPFIIVEVLSPATTNYDLSEKLGEYKHIEGLKQIVFVSQKKIWVSIYTRSENPNIWLNQDFEAENDIISIDNQFIVVKDIYRKVKFEN